MQEVTITVTITTTEIDAIQKAQLHLEHFRSYELSLELSSLWRKLVKASLNTITPIP